MLAKCLSISRSTGEIAVVVHELDDLGAIPGATFPRTIALLSIRVSGRSLPVPFNLDLAVHFDLAVAFLMPGMPMWLWVSTSLSGCGIVGRGAMRGLSPWCSGCDRPRQSHHDWQCAQAAQQQIQRPTVCDASLPTTRSSPQKNHGQCTDLLIYRIFVWPGTRQLFKRKAREQALLCRQKKARQKH